MGNNLCSGKPKRHSGQGNSCLGGHYQAPAADLDAIEARMMKEEKMMKEAKMTKELVDVEEKANFEWKLCSGKPYKHSGQGNSCLGGHYQAPAADFDAMEAKIMKEVHQLERLFTF